MRGGQSITKDCVTRSSFLQLLINLFNFYRSNPVMRKTLLVLFGKLVTHFSFSDFHVNQQISDLLVE